MKQEDKDLLLIDLCARVSYGLICKCNSYKYILFNSSHISLIESEDIKPYLRPMSNMTEEENIIYGDLCYAIIHSLPWDIQIALNELFDWLNKNHFDYRGLIPMGLANDATDLNIY